MDSIIQNVLYGYGKNVPLNVILTEILFIFLSATGYVHIRQIALQQYLSYIEQQKMQQINILHACVLYNEWIRLCEER